ncbi:MAG: hypothetical protein V2J07_02955 [Anaerolineae bacterium]|nr:hypothetical protein [Anaerolineae bacterium]
MKEPKKTVWFWLPRVIGILFTLFISLFGFDVFNMGIGFPEIILAFFMDMLPAILVAAVVALAWRWEWIGAILSLGLALFYLFGTNFDLDIVVILLIPGPLIVLGVLWLVAWLQKRNYLKTLAV